MEKIFIFDNDSPYTERTIINFREILYHYEGVNRTDHNEVKELEEYILPLDPGSVQSRDVIINGITYRFSETRFFHWSALEELQLFEKKYPNYRTIPFDEGYLVYESFLETFECGRDVIKLISSEE